VTLLRPARWLQAAGAQVGETIYLDLPDLGAQGDVEVVSIVPCPPIKPGCGSVVTGTFAHERAKNVVDLHIESQNAPIGVTTNHPFWSEDRHDFVRVDHLAIGERLRTAEGQINRLTAIVPRAGPHTVHNLEVNGEHVYRVGTVGLLVHNLKPSGIADDLVAQLELPTEAQRALMRDALQSAGTGRVAHHIIPFEAQTRYRSLVERAARGGFSFNGRSNGILLDAADHLGGHPGYNRAVLDHIERIDDMARQMGLSDRDVAKLFEEAADTLRKAVKEGSFGPWF